MVTGAADELPKAFLSVQDQQREAARWQRELEQLNSRHAHPLTAKISARPLDAKMRGNGQVDVVLKLNQQLHYMHGAHTFQQETSRIHKLSLQRINGAWGFHKPWEPMHLLHQGSQAEEVSHDTSKRTTSVMGQANRPGRMNHIGQTDQFEQTDERAAQHVQDEQVRAAMQHATVPVEQVQASGYDRMRAVRYADMYWDNPNPAYPYLNVDCTNFISQCLHAGRIPMIGTGNKSTGWWFRGWHENWSYSWAVANSLHRLLASGKAPMYAVRRSSPDELELGDVICYDFDGDGYWQHNTIVTAKDSNGMPLVNAHTTNSSKRYWEYKDSTAYTDNIKYDFFHIRGKE